MTDFAPEEYRARLHRAQAMMAREGLAALLLTTEPEVRYFTGFLTRFWESPARPWYLIVPASGDPVAVIPSIGAHLMGQSWITDIRTWRSPQPGDDGTSLLRDALAEVRGPVGVPSGAETHLRMPLDTWATLQSGAQFRDDAGIMRRLRLIKSDAEIDRIATICQIANAAFDRVPEVIGAGLPLSEVFRRFQILLLTEGADWVPYLAGAAGQGGYGDVISPATDVPLADGDVLMLDTGAVKAGYFCDFDRNFAVGDVGQPARDAHARLIEATEVAFEAATPGATAADLFHAMDRVLTGGAGGTDAGRLGHGLGMQLTEWPSLIAADRTVLEPGMVLTLEPSIALRAERIMVHEENIVITAEGPQWLSIPSDDQMVGL
ncbi:M24 family metallopeptidase [Pseudosulfitobacter koreensis]|uniref:Xaa-Pro peptidase family protein n=1 Tax=Pseudosulfitobacter koreensis TaxID=2968472 RepID=A0ABT1Z1N5_9RHOB|nr:Xaa-Pro peptidase family protein [Pseudosulfitobacter koreense]MCR8827051.1 Xaa-Pro peptidase family protein [Pseudosulfitobacter koreense]